MSKPEFVYVIYIQAPCEKVWDALLDPEMTKDYWGRKRNRSDWSKGATWQHEDYDDPSEVAIAGTVIESERPHRLVLSWARPANAGDPDKVSRVTFMIEEQFGSTKLTVVHSELDDEMLRGVSAGWPAILSSMKTLLETGASMPMTRQRWKGGK
ncbi:SRPBCC family protein [Bradyrhizobium sp. BRP22]|uniref:SRPBCC family protein n=1 Tax=Bradyrhizobium sp. BRP22 TaxID=2793821 RepID=UPI001CD45FBA|nr:SRPBCC family protein [Bradyrhizobium sp. BRP22]MCA1458637.1 SRPBCC family protein [Bradyrhizobium sp. BRP22]